jgi:hypothetical protein
MQYRYSFADATLPWLGLECVDSLLLRGCSSGLGRLGQTSVRRVRWAWPTISTMRIVLVL